MRLAVGGEQPAGFVEGDVVPQAGEDIAHPAVRRRRMAHAIGRQQGDAGAPRPVREEFIFVLLARQEVALDFREQPVAENPPQAPARLRRRGPSALAPGAAHRPLLVAGQREEAVVALGQFRPRHPPLPFRGAQVRGREQGTELAVARLRGDENRHHGLVLHREFAADQGAQARGLRGDMQPDRAVDAVAVAEGERGQPQFAGDPGQRLRRGAAPQK